MIFDIQPLIHWLLSDTVVVGGFMYMGLIMPGYSIGEIVTRSGVHRY